MNTSTLSGAILAGGVTGDRRPELRFGGELLIQRQLREMRRICDELIVVTSDPKPLLNVLPADVRIITDYFTGCGPLGGMHAALHLARSPLVWIAGGHMPFISAPAAQRLLDARRGPATPAVLPLVRGEPVPLHGVYERSCAAAAAELLSDGQRELGAWLGRIRWLGVPADGWSEPGGPDCGWAIGSDADYERALGMLSRV